MSLNIDDFGGNGSNDSETTNDNEATHENYEAIREMSNELAELYISIGDYANLLEVLRDEMGVEWPSMVSSPTMDDYDELRERHKDSNRLQQLTVLAVCLKGELGSESHKVNDHSIGLQDGKAPDSHEDYGKEGTPSYAHEHRDLPSITWEPLTEDEKDDLRELDVDPADLGFDPNFEGPKLLVVNGQRLPFGTEENALEIAENIITSLPEDPSAFTEDGFRESSDPSVFGDTEDDTDDQEALEVPEDGFDPTGLHIKDKLEPLLGDVNDLEALRRMLNIEDQNDNRKTAKQAINRRIRKVNKLEEQDERFSGSSRYSDENTHGSSQEEVEAAVEDDDEDPTDGFSEAEMNLMTALLNNDNSGVDTKEQAIEEVRAF